MKLLEATENLSQDFPNFPNIWLVFHGFLVGETLTLTLTLTYLRMLRFVSLPTTTAMHSRTTIITHIYSGAPYVLILRVLLYRPVYPFRDRYILLIMSVTHIMYPLLPNAVSHRLSSHDIHNSFHSPLIPLTTHSHSHVPYTMFTSTDIV